LLHATHPLDLDQPTFAQADLPSEGGSRTTPEELGVRMSAEVARWARVISEAGIEKQ
jgi:hypothetical protein